MDVRTTSTIARASPYADTVSEFQTISSPSRFFKKGRVFKCLWVEPAGNVDENDSDNMISTKFGEKAYAKIRHFVVATEMQGASLCLPLSTHNRNGVVGKGVRAANFAAVYPFGSLPEVFPNENLSKNPFPILVENPEERLDPMSRLDFGQVHTVRHNLKVLKVGRIHDGHLPLLDRYFTETVTSSTPTIPLDDATNRNPHISKPNTYMFPPTSNLVAPDIKKVKNTLAAGHSRVYITSSTAVDTDPSLCGLISMQ